MTKINITGLKIKIITENNLLKRHLVVILWNNCNGA